MYRGLILINLPRLCILKGYIFHNLNSSEDLMNILNKLIVTTIPVVPKPIVGYFSRRYIAGSRISDAISEVKRLNYMGMWATIDVLGESIRKLDEAEEPVKMYLRVLDEIDKYHLQANISVKPTQLGLMIDYKRCLDNYSRLLERATEYGNFVRIDMEDHSTTDKTLRLYTDLRKRYDNVGVVLQAYLRRSVRDIENLAKEVDRLNLRICKGIYIEPYSIAWKDFDIVRKNFEYMLEVAFNYGAYVGIATHDDWLIWAGMKIIHRLGIPKDGYEFQMLLGVKPDLRKIIVDLGHNLRVYTPFGRQWYPYSIRRLRENPLIAKHILKAIFRPAVR